MLTLESDTILVFLVELYHIISLILNHEIMSYLKLYISRTDCHIVT